MEHNSMGSRGLSLGMGVRLLKAYSWAPMATQHKQEFESAFEYWACVYFSKRPYIAGEMLLSYSYLPLGSEI